MTATIKRWGNSTGIRIPKEAMERSNLRLEDHVEISVFEGGITLQKKVKKNFSDIAKPLVSTKDWKFDREEANARGEGIY
ncbi:MAG: AbrB/MazE/SpoVT family DNA-binding domain-containing protein [Defluviitaleaceae bacterium]|nr:AbrB/MazE/SpoVT family DNA-binding domain-containing protein [Defluviitaleaceae bacterium]MCL2238462.1 AbrB/MazE/SpoVT family DNA-binding domain-containing protein [Defluviitaleaceae bacterium]